MNKKMSMRLEKEEINQLLSGEKSVIYTRDIPDKFNDIVFCNWQEILGEAKVVGIFDAEKKYVWEQTASQAITHASRPDFDLYFHDQDNATGYVITNPKKYNFRLLAKDLDLPWGSLILFSDEQNLIMEILNNTNYTSCKKAFTITQRVHRRRKIK